MGVQVNINIFKHIQEKYGQEILKIIRKIEKQRVKIAKVQCDIKLILHCKKENLFQTFTKPKFSIKINNYLRNKISRQILEMKLEKKKKKVRTTIKRKHHKN